MMRALLALLLTLAWPTAVAAQIAWADFPALIAEHEAAPAVPLLARAQLDASAPIALAVLSPDGRLLASLERRPAAARLRLQEVPGGRVLASFPVSGLRRFVWAVDSRHLVLELDHAVGSLAVTEGARPSYLARLDRADGDYVLGPDLSSPAHVLLVRHADEAFILERLNLSGEGEELYRTPARIEQALPVAGDDTLYLQLMDASSHSLYRLAEGERELILPCGVLDTCQLDAFDTTNHTLWLRSDVGQELVGLYAWSAESGDLQLVHSDSAKFTSVLSTVYRNGSPLLVQYQGARLRHQALNPSVQRHLDVLEAAFPLSNLGIQPSTGRYWLLREGSALLRDARHFLYDTGSHTLTPVLEREATLPAPLPDHLTRKQLFQYRARDGFLLNGYVSLPRGKPLREAPLVALVHGGPHGRVLADYSAPVHLLVNRGYAVFEPHFRASTGFGRSYMTGAAKDWGRGRVQQDILDGLDHLLRQGIGDSERQAIVGGSFGGFAVLSGLAFTPERFRAGVAFVPPAELGASFRYLASQPGFDRDRPHLRELMRTLIVDPDKPEEVRTLFMDSPYANLESISAPLLVMAGGEDRSVDSNHVKDYALTLQELGKPVSLLLDPEEGHEFRSKRARLALLYALEAFLAPQLGGRVEVLDEDLRHYLQTITRIDTPEGFLSP